MEGKLPNAFQLTWKVIKTLQPIAGKYYNFIFCQVIEIIIKIIIGFMWFVWFNDDNCDMHGDYVIKTKKTTKTKKAMLERHKSYVEVNCKNRATCYELVMGLLHSTGSWKDGPKCDGVMDEADVGSRWEVHLGVTCYSFIIYLSVSHKD